MKFHFMKFSQTSFNVLPLRPSASYSQTLSAYGLPLFSLIFSFNVAVIYYDFILLVNDTGMYMEHR